jgi:CRP/FNR family transcriptional regulator, anaerobic regulatory protein
MDYKDEIKISLLKIYKFTDDQLNAFIEKVRDKTLDKAEYLLKAGQRCNFLAFISTGSLRFYSTTEMDELTLHFFTERSWVTDYESLFSQIPSANHLQAMEKTEINIISLNDLHQLLEQYPEFRNVMKLLDTTIISSSHLKSITHSSPDERYQRLLKNNPEWINRFPQMHIASYLGMTKETFSRVKARVK